MATTNTSEKQSTVQKHYKAVYSHRDASKLAPRKDTNGEVYPNKIGENEIAIDIGTNTLVYGRGEGQVPITVANDAITTTKIKDGAVTTKKIANGAITTDKISDDFVAPKVANKLYFSGSNKVYDGSTSIKVYPQDLGLESALIFLGVTEEELYDGSTQSPIEVNEESIEPKPGNVVLSLLNSSANSTMIEYVWTGTYWEKFGDEGSFALKSTELNVGEGLQIQSSEALTSKSSLKFNNTIEFTQETKNSLTKANNAVQPDVLTTNYYNKNYIDKRLQDNRILLNNYYISPTNAISGIRDIGTEQTIEIDLVDSDKNPVTNVDNLMIASTNLIDYPNYLFYQAAHGGNGDNPRSYISEGNEVSMHYNLSVDEAGNHWIKGMARDFRYNYISLKPFKNKTIKVSATFLILNETPGDLMDNNPYIEEHDSMDWAPGSSVDGATRCYLRVTKLVNKTPEWPSEPPKSIWSIYEQYSDLKNDGKPTVAESPKKEYKQELVHTVQADNEVLTIWMNKTSQGLAIKDFQITLIPTNTGYENFQEPITFNTIFTPSKNYDEDGNEIIIQGSYQGILPHTIKYTDEENGDPLEKKLFFNSMYLFEGNNNVVDNDNKILLVAPVTEPVQIKKISGCYTNTSTAFELLSNRINELHNLTTTLTLLNP